MVPFAWDISLLYKKIVFLFSMIGIEPKASHTNFFDINVYRHLSWEIIILFDDNWVKEVNSLG